jgi:catechol 2,3-dioxygenase-like lactoylglutathione lyase family enzyme
MLVGAHVVLYSANAETDKAFFRDVLRLSNVDAGDGFLIFGLPPTEVAVHKAYANDKHELYFMCADVEAFIDGMKQHGIACTSIRDEGWGLVTQLTLPGGGRLGVYEPRHARPKPAATGKRRSSAVKRPSPRKARTTRTKRPVKRRRAKR